MKESYDFNRAFCGQFAQPIPGEQSPPLQTLDGKPIAISAEGAI